MAGDSIVRARIGTRTKAQATEALAALGLSVPDAIRLFLDQAATHRAMPFPLPKPNAGSRKAIEELEQGRGRRFTSPAALFEDLGL